MRKWLQCVGACFLFVAASGCRDGLGPLLKDIRTNAEEYTDQLMLVHNNENAKEIIEENGPLKKLKVKSDKIAKRLNRFLKYYEKKVEPDKKQKIAEEYADIFAPYFRDVYANSKRLKVQTTRLTQLYNNRPKGEDWTEMRGLIDATREFFSSTSMRPITQITQAIQSNKQLEIVGVGMSIAAGRVQNEIQKAQFDELFGDGQQNNPDPMMGPGGAMPGGDPANGGAMPGDPANGGGAIP